MVGYGSGCGRSDWQKLVTTGPPLGVLDDRAWSQRQVASILSFPRYVHDSP
jgi:hypothetical protein